MKVPSPVDRPIMLVVGTRPEVIKMAPVLYALRERGIPTVLCSTGQHTTLLKDLFALFELVPDYDLALGVTQQTLAFVHSSALTALTTLFKQVQPRLVLVQGDTTSALAAAHAAFYLQIPVGHIEAGLRTSTMREPFPEEYNRRAIALVTQYHFAPTAMAAAHLLREGIPMQQVYTVGNTVVDALHLVRARIKSGHLAVSSPISSFLEHNQQKKHPTVLFTMHRRESLTDGISAVLASLKQYVQRHPEVRIIFPMHPNPLVRSAVAAADLADEPAFYCCEPLNYADTVYLLGHVSAVVTDSGGLQEEAVSSSTPVIVTRNVTERMEGVQEGAAFLVGIEQEALWRTLDAILYGLPHNTSAHTVYGDGRASMRIAQILYDQVYSSLTVSDRAALTLRTHKGRAL